MKNKKMRLTESELQQVVETSVRQILMKEGFLKKIGDKIDRFENWVDDKMDDFHRGYDLKEGNPTYIFDVIKGDGWEPIKSRNGLKNGMNYIGVKKVRGSWYQANGLTDEKLVEDINIFLDGRGHASLYETVNDNYSILVIDAPLNLFEKAEVNESVYGDDGFESTSTMDVVNKNMADTSTDDTDEEEYDEDRERELEIGNILLDVDDILSNSAFGVDLVEEDEDGNEYFPYAPYIGIYVNGEHENALKDVWILYGEDNDNCKQISWSEMSEDMKDDVEEIVHRIPSKYDYDDDELYESFNMGGSDMVRFYLNSPMNGRQVITVPFEEFANAKYKNDYLWEKAAEQGNIKLMRNGYFEVDPNDPHKAEVDRIF